MNSDPVCLGALREILNYFNRWAQNSNLSPWSQTLFQMFFSGAKLFSIFPLEPNIFNFSPVAKHVVICSEKQSQNTKSLLGRQAGAREGLQREGRRE